MIWLYSLVGALLLSLTVGASGVRSEVETFASKRDLEQPPVVVFSPPGAPKAVYLPLVLKAHTTPSNQWVSVLEEGFEGEPGAFWRFYDADGAARGTYFWARRTCRPDTGSYSAWAVGGGTDGAALGCGSAYPDNASAWMIYGPFSLADAAAAELRFRLWLNRASEVDRFCWGASSDGVTFPGVCLSGTPSGWTSLALDLADVGDGVNMLGKSQVWAAFVFQSDGAGHMAEGVYVDNVSLRTCLAGPCPATAMSDVLAGSARRLRLPVAPRGGD